MKNILKDEIKLEEEIKAELDEYFQERETETLKNMLLKLKKIKS